MPQSAPRLSLRVHHGTDIAMGPGKADLLEAIARDGSISAAARAMGMSYRRAWVLVDTMNRCFRAPLVATHPGSKGAGAAITKLGTEVLAAYRALEAKTRAAEEYQQIANACYIPTDIAKSTP